VRLFGVRIGFSTIARESQCARSWAGGSRCRVRDRSRTGHHRAAQRAGRFDDRRCRRFAVRRWFAECRLEVDMPASSPPGKQRQAPAP